MIWGWICRASVIARPPCIAVSRCSPRSRISRSITRTLARLSSTYSTVVLVRPERGSRIAAGRVDRELLRIARSVRASSIQKVEPRRMTLSTPIVPSIDSTSDFDNARPTPVPSISLVRVESLERHEQPPSTLFADARSAVDHADPHVVADDAQRESRTVPEIGVVLHRVRHEVQQDLLQPLMVRRHGDLRGDVRRDGDVLVAGQRPHQADHRVDRLVDVNGLERQGEVSGGDPRDVEQIVDEPEQVPAGLHDLVDGLAVVGVE